MILNFQNLYFSFSSQLKITMCFEIDPICTPQNYIDNAIHIVNILKEKYPNKVEYHSLWGFTMDFDINFVSLLLIYLILEFEIKVKINGNYINSKQNIYGILNEIQDLMIEFSKLEMLRISQIKRESSEALDLLENEVILI